MSVVIYMQMHDINRIYFIIPSWKKTLEVQKQSVLFIAGRFLRETTMSLNSKSVCLTKTLLSDCHGHQGCTSACSNAAHRNFIRHIYVDIS